MLTSVDLNVLSSFYIAATIKTIGSTEELAYFFIATIPEKRKNLLK
jgi:hypothetical protein